MIIVKVPGLNNLGKNNGCRDSGEAILESLYDKHNNKQGNIIDKKLLSIKEVHLDNSNVEEQNNLIFEKAKEIFQNKDKTIFLGGDHSISFPIGKAFFEYCKENKKEACLLVFDAHADCDYSCREPTHEEWLRALIDFGFNKENVLLVGCRKLWKVEAKFLNEKKIRRIGMNELMLDLEGVTDMIMEFSKGKELYVSFDIDVVDPVYAPSTYHKEPAGLTSRQAIYIISRISKMKNLRCFDIVEVNSERDKEKGRVTIKLAAKLLGYIFKN